MKVTVSKEIEFEAAPEVGKPPRYRVLFHKGLVRMQRQNADVPGSLWIDKLVLNEAEAGMLLNALNEGFK
jgi:hypothetical protein